MNILRGFREGLQQIWDGVIRIFSPSRDEYPESGVQPYEGDPYHDDHRHGN